ncbi:hypothetical protein [Chryseobacterium sp.]|uniref:hypothetical protein n=1 Tax=Chryseobacterium sp. TaxID=1871047 RepID=UPI00321A83F3
MKVHKHQVPLYFQFLNIVVTENFTESLDKLKLTYDKSDPVNKWESFVGFEYGKIWIFVRSKTDVSVIAHEAVHIVNYVFKQAHISLDLDNDEPQAYLMGWVVDKIIKAIGK